MKLLDTLFFKHPKENKMSYMQHFVGSFYMGTYLFICSCKAIIHAFIPYFFETSTTDCVKSLDNYLKSIHD